MALSTLAKEEENFLRYAILIVDHSKTALTDLLELNLRNKHLTFKKFLDQNQHEIYHLCYDSKCCQCHTSPPRRKRIIYPSQLELLFDKHNKFSSHTATHCTDFCCSKSKVSITTEVLDISLARCLLVNCCLEVFWFTCLTAQGKTLEQFLNLNKHIIYHLWKNNQSCCQCKPGFIYPCDYSVMTATEWNNTFKTMLVPCARHRKRLTCGSTTFCTFAAKPGIALKDIDIRIQGNILKYCCPIRKDVECLVEHRNKDYGHIKTASLSDVDFNDFSNETVDCLLNIARMCGKEQDVKDVKRYFRSRPVDATLCSHYQNTLLETINRNESISENVVSEHTKTRKEVSCKLRKLEDRIESLETSFIEIKAEVQGLRKLITDRSTRSQVIRETLAEIDYHRKDQTYTEINAVTACVQMLDNNKVLILSGKEGSGKSRNSLEILRKMKEKHQAIDVIKLNRLTQLTDVMDRDKQTIVLFEDVFGRVSRQFCENRDIQILDALHSYIMLDYVKVIFIIRNDIKHECKNILSKHEIFNKNVGFVDLDSGAFQLSHKEKERLFINNCTNNGIEIIYRKKIQNFVCHTLSINKLKTELECRVSVDDKEIYFDAEAVQDIIQSAPYHGFPQCCLLFTKNRKFTLLGAAFFKYPFKSLLKEIENMRMEGKDNDVKGLKYVILVYTLLNESLSPMTLNAMQAMQHLQYEQDILSINENNIDVQAHQKLFNECYNKTFRLKLNDIIYLYEELTPKYLIRKQNKIYFQHRALRDSVLISYSKTNENAIIPLLSMDHMTDIVRTQTYMEQEEEVVLKISKSNYPELAAKIISLMDSELYYRRYRDRFMESKIITDDDVDLIYELLSCINNRIDTSDSYTHHYFPLYLLLRIIDKLDDNELTVNHTKDQLLISVTIGYKNISFGVDPNISLICALQSKYIDTIKWLFKNTDHTLMDFKQLCFIWDIDVNLTSMQLLFENVKHEMLDMTQLFTNMFYGNEKEQAIDLIVDNVDNSLICYDKCMDHIFEMSYYELPCDLIVYILKKVNHKWLNISNIVYKTCQHGSCNDLLKVLQNVDLELFDKKELINTVTIIPDNDDDENSWKKIIELILPWINDTDFNKLVEQADTYRSYGVLELLITHVTDLSIDIVQLIEKMSKWWDTAKEMDGEYDDDHIENVFRFLIKHHIDKIGVADIIMEKACHVGSHCVVEELLMDKNHNISYYLNITLDKCLSRRLNEISVSNSGSFGKLLMLFIQKVDFQFIDLNSLMIDVCNIGHSSAVLWLLENKHSHCFDLRNVMNKASYHADRELVEYLNQNYKAGDFDYKTAMIKACRNSQEKTLDVCKWLWANIDRDLFDMKVALNNASRYDNTDVVEWILTNVDKGSLDIELAVLCASEHGGYHTVKFLLDNSSINMIDFEHAISLACKNENNYRDQITKLLYERADKSTVDINVVFSVACKNYRSDIVQWMIETCDHNITVTETNDGNKNFIMSLDKHLLDISHALNCIAGMDSPDHKTKNVDDTKRFLLRLILKKYHLRTIDLNKLLTEFCKKDWLEIFISLLGKVDNSFLNIREAINVACEFGALNIVKWSLQNVDVKLLPIENVMVESCAYGWLECLVLIQKRCCHYAFNFQQSMVEACTYGRLEIVEWLLQNVNYERFHLPLLLHEAGRNGWLNIINWLVNTFKIRTSDLHVTTNEALANGHLRIVELMVSVLGRECIEITSVADKIYLNSGNEAVVKFIFKHFDPRALDIATVFTNACKFGWKDTTSFILDNDLSSLCDFDLAFDEACDNGETEIIKLLLEKVDHQILDVKKAMQSVAVKGWDEIAVLVLDNVEHTRLDIGNALIEACRHGEVDVVQAILRKVDSNMLDVETALYKACENHMHEELVLWVLESINQEQVDLKTVKKQAVRHKWWKVQFSLTKVDIEDLKIKSRKRLKLITSLS